MRSQYKLGHPERRAWTAQRHQHWVANGWARRVQVALFDRIHSIRVKAIQEEYQRYMERVRTKAQNAIDQANTQYQHSRTMLTAHVDTLVHYLQNRHLQVRAAPAICRQAACACGAHVVTVRAISVLACI